MSLDYNKALLDFTVEHAPEAIYWVDQKGVIRNVNQAACKMLKYTKAELIGIPVPLLNPELSLKDFQSHFKQLSESKTIQFRSSQLTKDGEEIPVDITSNIVEVDGELMSCTYIRDIREIENIERILRINEDRWKAGLEMLSEGVWDWDLSKGKVEFSNGWVKNYGYDSHDESYHNRIVKIVHPDNIESVKLRLADHLDQITDEYQSKHRIRDEHGQWHWVKDRGRVISRDSHGAAQRMIGITHDLTDIIESETKKQSKSKNPITESSHSLEDIRDKFLNIFNNSTDAIFIGDPDKNLVIDVNPKACELLGYKKDELLKINLTELIPNQRKTFIDFFNRVKRNKSAQTDQLVFKAKSGQRIFTDVSASVFSINGENGILGIVHTESDEGRFERIIGKVSEAVIVNPDRGIIGNFLAETSRVLRVQYAGMTRIIKQDPLTVRVVNLWEKDGFGESFEYEVTGSPCEHVVDGDFHAYERDVMSKFPKSKLFGRFKAESYMAVPISDSQKNPIGHFFLCDDGIMERKNWIENLLRLGALRMRLEIERTDALEALEVLNQNLEAKVEERTKALTQANANLEDAIKEVEELRDKLHAENVYLKEEIKLNHNFEDIISKDKGFKKVLNEVEKVAKTNSTVLILGETGTGKEVLTRSIHSISDRSNKPLVKVNCAALPATLIESELFGHEKGAYTGATSSRQGRFELADEGTLFLDEVGEIPLELQPKLLRALQEGEFERVGGVKTLKVDVRVIAATNRNLEESVEKGEFRSDLFYRLNVFPISVPPLRDRKEDIPLLVKHFINKYSQKLGNEITKIPQSTIKQLTKYNWPGNVRELENIIERAVIVSEGGNLKIGDWLKGEVEKGNGQLVPLEEFEREYIIKVLNKTNWKISGKNGAAEILDMKPTTLESRMKKLNITRPGAH